MSASRRPAPARRKLSALFPVDAVPALLRPLFALYAFAAAAVLFLYFRLVWLSGRVEIRGRELLTPGENYIFTCWHDAFPLYMATGPSHRGQVWMVHPDWYMKPMHLLARWTGVEELILGSSGHRGQEAKKELEEHLRAGRATTFLPDGPSEHPRRLKRGILDMALETGVAIAPMTVSSSRVRRLRTWDRKRIPLPFSRIELTFYPPIEVRSDTVDMDAAALARSLSSPPPG